MCVPNIAINKRAALEFTTSLADYGSYTLANSMGNTATKTIIIKSMKEGAVSSIRQQMTQNFIKQGLSKEAAKKALIHTY